MFDIKGCSAARVRIVSGNFMQSQWAALLRRGVGVAFDHALPVKNFMIDVLGMDAAYATEQVPGLFLNNAPVDDWAEELVCAGDQLGMSGTMPGMAGIALRRSSPISAFRADLHSRHDDGAPGGGVATVKMFNFIAQDCAASILRHGVLIPGKILRAYLDDQDIVLEDCICYWNEDKISGEQFRMALEGISTDIVLCVTTE